MASLLGVDARAAAERGAGPVGRVLFLEPRLDLPTSAKISVLASLPMIPAPQPDE
jgi:hypothetical protein